MQHRYMFISSGQPTMQRSLIKSRANGQLLVKAKECCEEVGSFQGKQERPLVAVTTTGSTASGACGGTLAASSELCGWPGRPDCSIIRLHACWS